MRTERIELLGAVALLIVSVVLGAVAYLLYENGKAGTPPRPQAVPGYQRAGIAVYAPRQVDVSVSVTYTAAGDPGGDQYISVSATPRPVLLLVELTGSARLISSKPGTGTFVRPTAPRVDLPALPSRILPGYEGPPARQMYLVQTDPEVFFRDPVVRGDSFVSALQSDNSRTTFASPSVVVRKCPTMPRSIDEVRTPTGYDTARLGALADGGGPAFCDPDDADYRGRDRGLLSIRGTQEGAGPIRVDYAKPDASKDPPEDFDPLLGWAWTPDWSPDGSFSAEATLVDLNQESRGQSRLFISGVLIGIASAMAPAGVGLVADRILRRRDSAEPVRDEV